MCKAISESLGTDLKESGSRILLYYVPIALWLEEMSKMKNWKDGAPVVGLSMPQGAGKTTMADCMRAAMKAIDINVAYMSIDDFYLTREDQVEFGEDNLYLSGRGVAGTHDLNLGANIIKDLKFMNSDKDSIGVPTYDKSAHSGKGDRSSERRVVFGPVDLVLVEGWMLGYQPLNEKEEIILEAKY